MNTSTAGLSTNDAMVNTQQELHPPDQGNSAAPSPVPTTQSSSQDLTTGSIGGAQLDVGTKSRFSLADASGVAQPRRHRDHAVPQIPGGTAPAKQNSEECVRKTEDTVADCAALSPLALLNTGQDPCLESFCSSSRDGWLLRGKRFDAVMNVWFKIAELTPCILKGLPPITFYTPALGTLGCVHQYSPTGTVMYLSPTLEFESQRRVDFVVAHEFAHIALGHHKPDNDQVALQSADKSEIASAELQADSLAASWGFKRVKRYGNFERLLRSMARQGFDWR